MTLNQAPKIAPILINAVWFLGEGEAEYRLCNGDALYTHTNGSWSLYPHRGDMIAEGHGQAALDDAITAHLS